ncbi:F0F1 ATP synthase subunit A [Salinisphaera sp. Q1T1-3]|uniref:F0F1 ATP synthase subunit A n=1 Tax=Salinisphaera sp. Q1T1-3 TaxID=2321229 RepID=UPI000E70F16E|nr:F0F1 ATP synthase subunit A [Salinisphaera sp. Q1T1-3]RJS93329.1 ATP synthase F0 subunit A [Salinisphaera sp. Q1T1-3]
MANSGGGSAEYITHHLTDWCAGCTADHKPGGLVDFSVFTLDLIIVGLVCAAIVALFSLFVRKRLTAEEPGALQAVVEAGVEYVSDQVGQVFHKRNDFVGALAVAIFLWVSLMNLADIIPVDLVPGVLGGIGHLFGADHVFFRIVPTAALDTPFAMALVVFVVMVYYQFRANGPGGYAKRFLTHPYGKWAAPANILTTFIDDVSKPVSLALRLFGNMFAGELIFALLAMLTLSALAPPSGMVAVWAPLHFLGGFIWSVFHLLIVFLQAFIFAVLSIVYLGMATQTDDH